MDANETGEPDVNDLGVAPPTVSVEIDEWVPSGAAEGAQNVTVRISDPQHAPLVALLNYLITERSPLLYSFTLTQPVEDGGADALSRIGARVVRDVPVARWDRAAQAAIWRSLSDNATPSAGGEMPLGKWFDLSRHGVSGEDENGAELTDPGDAHRTRAERTVRNLHPNLNPDAGKGAARTWNTLVRYATVSYEHIEAMAEGVKDPIGVLAKRHGVEPTTVRSWLHRARRAGITSTSAIYQLPPTMYELAVRTGASRWSSDDMQKVLEQGDVNAILRQWVIEYMQARRRGRVSSKEPIGGLIATQVVEALHRDRDFKEEVARFPESVQSAITEDVLDQVWAAAERLERKVADERAGD